MAHSKGVLQGSLLAKITFWQIWIRSQKSTALSWPKPPPSLPYVGVQIFIPGANVLVGPSQFAAVCMGPVARPSGTQRNSIQQVFSEHLIRSFPTYLLRVYYTPDIKQGGGRRSGEQDRAHRLAWKAEVKEFHRVSTDEQRATWRQQHRVQ